jgi:hypothetical protein
MNRNGIYLDLLLETVEGIRQHPEAGTVTVGGRSDADDAVLEGLGQTTSRTSPVYDSLVYPVPLQLRVRRLP